MRVQGYTGEPPLVIALNLTHACDICACAEGKGISFWVEKRSTEFKPVSIRKTERLRGCSVITVSGAWVNVCLSCLTQWKQDCESVEYGARISCLLCGATVRPYVFEGTPYILGHRHADQRDVSNPMNAPRVCPGNAPEEVRTHEQQQWARESRRKQQETYYSLNPTQVWT